MSERFRTTVTRLAPFLALLLFAAALEVVPASVSRSIPRIAIALLPRLPAPVTFEHERALPHDRHPPGPVPGAPALRGRGGRAARRARRGALPPDHRPPAQPELAHAGQGARPDVSVLRSAHAL